MKCNRLIIFIIILLILVALASASSTDDISYNLVANTTDDTSVFVLDQPNPIFNITEIWDGDTSAFDWNVTIGKDAPSGIRYFKSLTNHSGTGSLVESGIFNVTVWAKTGLVPTAFTPGSPFYIMSGSNPILNITELGEGDQAAFDFLVNGTGLIDETYTMFLYSNASNVANVNSSEINVTIILEDEFPIITFNFQTPADLNTSYYGFLNISYNISETTSGINVSTVLLHYKANSSTSDIFYYLNDTTFSGYSTRNIGISNVSDTWYFKLSDNYFYPATYNFDEPILENTTHEAFDLDFDNEYVRIRFLNFSNTKNYTIFEVMAQNQTFDALTLRIYFCNETYTTSKVFTSESCTNGYNLPASTPYNHEHTNYSSHHVIPVGIDTATGTIGGIYMPPKMYVVIRGRKAKGWNLYYINNASNSVEYSNDDGSSWTNQSVTVDAHFHQYDGTDTFYYFSEACANNGLCINSSVRSDLFDLAGLPPSSPDVYSPSEGNYSGNIPINYTAAISPNAYEISHYNISLVNPDQTFNLTIIGNNSQNLNYLWDSTAIINGNWSIKVQAYDVLNQTSIGYTELFTIDNIPPYFSNAINVSETYKKYTNFTANITIDDAYTGLSSYIFSTNNSGSWLNDSAITIVGMQYNASISKNISQPRGSNVCWYYWASDTAGSGNSSETYCFDVQDTAPTQTAPIINASNIENRTNADLNCYNQTTFDLDDDPLTNTYDWFRNDTRITALINLTTIASSNTSKDDTWLCQVRPNDGILDGISLNSSLLTILGTPPTIPSINITSSDPFNYSNGTLTGFHNYYSIDGDVWIYNWTKWYKDNVEQSALENLTSVASGNLSRGETWIYSAAVGNTWSNFSNASIFIENAPIILELPNRELFGQDQTNWGDITQYITDPDQETLTFTVANENTSQVNCGVIANGSSLTAQVDPLFYGLTNCTIQVVGGGNGDNSTFNITAWNKVGLVPTTSTIGAPFYITDIGNPFTNYSEFGAPPHHQIPFSFTLNVSASAGTYAMFLYSNASLGGANVNSTQINVTITLNPIITLNEPVDVAQLYYKNKPFLFNYSVAGDAPFNCSLYLNNTLNQTNTSVNEKEITNFQPINLDREDFKWRVDCYDSLSRFGSSVNRTLSILNSDPYYTTFPDIAFDEDTYNDTVNPGTYFVDDDGDDLNWTFEVSPTQLNMSINNNTNYTLITAVSDWNGIGYSNITAHDGYGGSNQSNTFTITVHPVNDPPIQGVPIINSTVRLNSTVENITVYNTSTYDVDDNKLTNIYNWYENGTSLTVLNIPFDTNSTSTVRDYSTHENNGTISGATWTPSGLDGGAYSFDGINDYIKIQNDSTIVWNATDMTWDIDFKRLDLRNSIIFDKSNQTETKNYRLEICENKLEFAYAVAIGGGITFTWNVTTQSDFDEGIYYQTFYNTSIGAVQLNQTFTSGNYTSKITNGVSSNTQWVNFTFIRGAPYEVELPNYKQNETVLGGVNMTDNVILLHMNEPGGNTIEDFSGSGNNGTANNFDGDEYNATGVFNTALDFDSINDFVNLGSDSSIDNVYTNFGTFSGWINPEDDGELNVGRIYDKGGYNILSLLGYNGTHVDLQVYRFFGTQGGVWRIGSIIPVNEWTNIAVRYNSSSVQNNPWIWINGERVTVNKIQGPSGSFQSDAAFDYAIGARSDGLRGFNGTIDEFALFDKYLEESEIQNLYKRGGLKLNISVRSCDDSLCAGESWAETFNSTEQILSISNNRYFGFKVDSASNRDDISPEIYNTSTTYSLPEETIRSISNITDDEFHNAVVTYESSTGNISIYLDGNIDASEIKTLKPLSFGNDLFIGIRYPELDRGFNGTIDSFKIWNRTLTPAQILKNWQENKTTDYKTLLSDETTLGNFYSSCITLNDAFLETTSCSPNMTIILAAPIVTVQDITMDEDTWNYTYLSDWVLDYDTPDNDINWTYNNTVVNATISISNVTKIMNITPLVNKTGTFDITLTAYDPDGQFGSDSLTVTILPVNDGPYLSPIPNQDVSTDRELTYQTTCTDIDNTTLLYYVNDSIVSINGTGYLYDAPNISDVGTYWINTTCGDGEFNSSQVFRYRVFEVKINFTYSPGISQIIFPINYTKFNFTSMTLIDRNVSAINQTSSLPVLIFNNTAGLGANVVFKLNGSYPPDGWTTHKFRCSNTSALSNSMEINLSDQKFVYMPANSSANAWCWGSYLNASGRLDFNFSITND